MSNGGDGLTVASTSRLAYNKVSKVVPIMYVGEVHDRFVADGNDVYEATENRRL